MQKKVTIYSTPSCGYCQVAKEWMKRENIEFEDVDVAANANRRQELFEKSGQIGVPVIDVDGQLMVGFDRSKVQEFLM